MEEEKCTIKNEDPNPEKAMSVHAEAKPEAATKKQANQDTSKGQQQRSFQPVKTAQSASFHGNISYKRAKSGEIANSIERDLLMRSGLAQLAQQPMD